jgi:hypothetical protein
MHTVPSPLDPTSSAAVLPVHCVTEPDYAQWRSQQPDAVRAWLDAVSFLPDRGRWSLLPDTQRGGAAGVVVGLGKTVPDTLAWFWLAAGLADRLPGGEYQLATEPHGAALTCSLGWLHGQRVAARWVAPARLTFLPGASA